MKYFFLLVFLLFCYSAIAQNTEEESEKKLVLSGYTDVYYAWFSDSVGRNNLQQFTTVSPRSNQIGLNTAQLTASYLAEKVRGTFTFHYGDIAKATWSEDFPFVQEANVGVRIQKNFWFDAGFFATHLGTESFLPKNNLLSSTAVATYNEPFYQAGARLSYEGSDKMEAQLWVLNGYNYFLDFNEAKSIGMLVSYAFSESWNLTYTNILGNEAPDYLHYRQYRVYQNLYLNGEVRKWQFILGGDVGTQSNSSLKEEYTTAFMMNALATVRYQFNSQFSVTGRVEKFNDENGFISGTFENTDGNLQGLQLTGLTLGVECKPAEQAYIRLETRYIQTNPSLEIFSSGEKPENQRIEVLATFGVLFDKVLSF